MDVQHVSLRSRRRHPRHHLRLPIRIQTSFFRRNTFAELSDANRRGFKLLSNVKFSRGQKIAFKLGDGPLFRAVCLWFQEGSNGQKAIAGWILIKCSLQDRVYFKNATGLEERPLLEDRRERSNYPAMFTGDRLEDALQDQSVSAPDESPIYRRTTERRWSESCNEWGASFPQERSVVDRRSCDRRRKTVLYEQNINFISHSFRGLVILMRDAILPYLPRELVSLFVGKGDFAFIAHPRNQKDVGRMFPFARWFPESWIKQWFMRQKPFIASRITNLKNKRGEPINGWLVIAPRWTVQMMKNNEMARSCIAESVALAEKIGAKIVGLGAFTSIVTHDGKDLLPHTSIGLTTGNPLSAAIAIQNAVKAAQLVGLDLSAATLSIIGAGGSVGSGCARVLAKRVKRLRLVDINLSAIKNLAATMHGAPAELVCDNDLTHILEADIMIVATNSPGVIIREKHIKPGCIVIDCAQPKNVSETVPRRRNDVLVIESAILETPGVDCHFNLDIGRYEALGCLAETMVLSAMGWPSTYAIGKAQEHQIEEIYAAAKKLGFTLAYFRNSNGLITEELLENVRSIIKRTHLV